MGATPKLDLYLDDLGPRKTEARADTRRNDGLDAFAFGGFLCRSEDAFGIGQTVSAFAERFKLSAPLHSAEIRGKRGNFEWLARAEPEWRSAFYEGLRDLLVSLPIHCILCAIDRPNYNSRFAQAHGDLRWRLLCRSAYPIVLERAAKFADMQGRRLEVFLEECGKHEDRAVRQYHENLCQNGQEFDPATSDRYQPMSAADFSRIVIRKPRFIKKSNPLAQVADLVLYPMVKSGYTLDYKPFLELEAAGKLTRSLSSEAQQKCDLKYYCFK